MIFNLDQTYVEATEQPRSNQDLVDHLARSNVYRDFEKSFGVMTGLPIKLSAAKSCGEGHCGKLGGNRFCGLVEQQGQRCDVCPLETAEAIIEGRTVCEASLFETAVPIHLGHEIIGYLCADQVFHDEPTEAEYDKTRRRLTERGIKFDDAELRDAYFSGHVFPAAKHDAALKLLAIFANHLSMISNQIFMQQETKEPPMITKAKQFIREHHAEELSLGKVAAAVNTSRFNFCKAFKKATGLNYTDYVSRVRVEQAKEMLLNPNARVSEVAFAVGFQSLTHFNRVFKRVVGQSPSEYRSSLPNVAA